jgi:predicted dehydrogenase
MIAACLAAGVHLHVAYYRRFWDKFVALKQAIEGGWLGTILGARLLMTTRNGATGWRTDPGQSGGGHVVDVGSHRLDMLTYLLGEVEAVHGFAENRLKHHPAENDSVLSLRFTSGVLASAAFHFHTHPNRDLLEIYGSDATATCDPFDGAMLRIGEEVTGYTNPTPTHLPFVEALVQVYNGVAVPHVTGQAGRAATQILDALRP